MTMTTLSLRTLLDRVPSAWGTLAKDAANLDAIAIESIAEDSRRVRDGTFFVAHRGRGVDGHRFIAAAVEAGAVAVAGEIAPSELARPLPDGVPYWQVEDGRLAFALLSAALFDYPSRKMTIIGVTGTDGKTTTSTLIHGILTAAGIQAGLITTVSALIGNEALDTGFHVTTPEAFDLQRYLAHMAAVGCQAAVVESTSHALDQHRVAYVDYDVAAVTNVTHEHLDWHGSWDNYMAAKARLFAFLAETPRKPGVPKAAILNRDDQSYAVLRSTRADKVLTYSVAGAADADCTASEISVGRDGTRFMLHTPVGTVPVRLRLFGEYNVANALAAAGAALALDVPLATIAAGLETVERIKGRMEWVYAGDFDVIVDFAHTPNALRETIRFARGFVKPGERVIVVFGSAGLRDVAKRRMMGEVAAAADLSVLTAEDPRTEDVNDIIEEIADGLRANGRQEGADFVRVADRAEAITTAIRLARPGDVVVTCGKAHERSMCYGTTETPWDEFAAVRAGLQARGV